MLSLISNVWLNFKIMPEVTFKKYQNLLISNVHEIDLNFEILKFGVGFHL